jgi:hypothetical protein
MILVEDVKREGSEGSLTHASGRRNMEVGAMRTRINRMRNRRRALGLALCAYFATLNAAVHILHTEGADHLVACPNKAARGTAPDSTSGALMRRADSSCRDQRHAEIGSQPPRQCRDAPATCLACLYVKNCLGALPQFGVSVVPPVSIERPATSSTIPAVSERRSPALPRAPPASA